MREIQQARAKAAPLQSIMPATRFTVRVHSLFINLRLSAFIRG
jgi:hypothetical protein